MMSVKGAVFNIAPFFCAFYIYLMTGCSQKFINFQKQTDEIKNGAIACLIFWKKKELPAKRSL